MKLGAKNQLRLYRENCRCIISAVTISCWLVRRHGCHAYLSTLHLGRTIRSLGAAENAVLDSGSTSVYLPSKDLWGRDPNVEKEPTVDGEVDLSSYPTVTHLESANREKSSTERVSASTDGHVAAVPVDRGHSNKTNISSQENRDYLTNNRMFEEASGDGKSEKQTAPGCEGGIAFYRSASPEGMEFMAHDAEYNHRGRNMLGHEHEVKIMQCISNVDASSSMVESSVSTTPNVGVKVGPRGSPSTGDTGEGNQARWATSTTLAINECTMRKGEEEEGTEHEGDIQDLEATAIQDILQQREARDAEVRAAGARVAETLPDSWRDTFLKLKAFAYGAVEGTGEGTPTADCLSAEEARALETMAICGDRDGVVLGFLRHVDFNLGKAKASMRRCCAWRIETNVRRRNLVCFIRDTCMR